MAKTDIIITEFDDDINFYYEWLPLEEDLQLKILILTSVLAENNLAYRGSLSTMCTWLGISSCSINNGKIKQALEVLQDKKLINYYKDGRTYVIAITNAGMKNKDVLRVRRAWINAFKSYKSDISIGWLQLVKVFVYICSRAIRQKEQLIITRNEVAEALEISPTTVGNALKCITRCNLDGITFQKEVEKERIKDNSGQTIAIFNKGTSITIGYNWRD